MVKPDGGEIALRRRAVPQVLPARRLRRHRADAAPRRQDPRLRGRAAAEAAVARDDDPLMARRTLARRRADEDRDPAGRRHRHRDRRPGRARARRARPALRDRARARRRRRLRGARPSAARGDARARARPPTRCCSAPSATGSTTSSSGRCGPSRRSSACARRSACSPTSGRRSAIPSSTRASSLKPELVAGLDILIIRELTGDIYFGQPRGRRAAPDGAFAGAEEAFDTMRYTRPGDRAHRPRRLPAPRASAASALTSVDKANVLETFQFWKDVVTEVHAEYPGRRARPHVRRQRGDAAGAGAEEVRRRRHRQHVRRHPVRRGGDADRLDRHAAVGVARRRTARASTSRATAARPTSPARTSPIRWLQFCPSP